MYLYWQMLYTKLAREKAEDEAILRGIKQSNLQTVLFLAHLNRLYPLAAQPIRVQ